MKILRTIFALLLVLPVAAHAQTFPKLTGRVVDAANLLSPEQEAQLTQLSEQVEQASTRQFVVATIPDLQGYPIEDYGYRLGQAWKIGQGEASNGIILIVAPKEREVRIEVGKGLEPIMTDGFTGLIIDQQIVPRFKAGDMGGGILAGAQAIGEQMKLPLEAAEAKAKAAADKKATRTANQRRSSSGGFPWGLLFWGIILVFVIFPMIFRRRERQGPWGARRYRRSGGSDLPIILWTIANEMSRSSHRGGSSWGGGGWSGGGGGGFGGGGGGFSGGGGSFGGGGASGSW
jgi:uncharacterized protein